MKIKDFRIVRVLVFPVIAQLNHFLCFLLYKKLLHNLYRMSFKRKQANPQQKNVKSCKSQRIGITLKLKITDILARDVTDRRQEIVSVQGQNKVLLTTLFHEIIHILMYFIERRQLCLEQESANYGNQERTNFKQELQQITCTCLT